MYIMHITFTIQRELVSDNTRCRTDNALSNLIYSDYETITA